MRAIKACSGCWRSYDADQLELLTLESVSADGRREMRACGCGTLLEIERAWLTEAREDEHGTTPELVPYSRHVVLMLWQLPDGSHQARKVSLHHLRRELALLDELPDMPELSDNPPDTCAAP